MTWKAKRIVISFSFTFLSLFSYSQEIGEIREVKLVLVDFLFTDDAHQADFKITESGEYISFDDMHWLDKHFPLYDFFHAYRDSVKSESLVFSATLIYIPFKEYSYVRYEGYNPSGQIENTWILTSILKEDVEEGEDAPEHIQNEVMLEKDILFNGKLERYFSTQDFKKVFGKPDSVVLMSQNEPCSYIFENPDGSKDGEDTYWYKDESRFENNQERIAVDQFWFTKENYILYKGIKINASTSINDLKSLFPNAIENIENLCINEQGELQRIQLREDEEGISDGHINICFMNGKALYIWWWFPC